MEFSPSIRSLVLRPIGVLVLGLHAVCAETPLWSEEFDGDALNLDLWNYDVGGGGWGNDELQEYTEDNVAVRNGALIITAKKEVVNRGKRSTINFTSGRIKTNQKFAFTYGTVKAKMQVPNLADGLWPALWMLGSNFDEGVGWPDCGEIDIMEMGYLAWLSADACLNSCQPDCLANGPSDPDCECCGGDGTVNSSVNSAFHYENAALYAGYYCEPRHLATEAFAGTDKWVEFTLEWTPQTIQTFTQVEGSTHIHRMCDFNITDPDKKDLEEFHKPFFFIANMAVGGRYTGMLYNTDRITAPFPAELKIDYIRLFDNNHTVISNLSSTISPAPTPAPTTAPPADNDCSTLVDAKDAQFCLARGCPHAKCQRYCCCAINPDATGC